MLLHPISMMRTDAGGAASLTYVGGDLASGAVTVPAHSSGDILIGVGCDDDNVVVTSVTDWTYIDTAGYVTADVTMHYRISDGAVSSFNSGMDLSGVLVYSPSGTPTIGTTGSAGGNDGSPAIPALTLDNTDGTSHVVAITFHRNCAGYSPNTALLVDNQLTIGSRRGGLFRSNGAVSSWSSDTMSASSSYWATFAAEIKVS